MRELLLIDPELDELQPLKDALEAQGITVTHHTGGAQATAYAAAHKPSCILLCVELVGVSGYSICNKLKKDPELRTIPLVLASGQASAETFEEHRRLRTRADGYLAKPYVVAATLAELAACAPQLGLPQPEASDEALDEAQPSQAAQTDTDPDQEPADGGVSAFSIPPEHPVPQGRAAGPHGHAAPRQSDAQTRDSYRPEPAWAKETPQGAMGEALMSEDAQLLLEGSIDTHRDTQVIRLSIAPSGAQANDLIGAALADMAAFPAQAEGVEQHLSDADADVDPDAAGPIAADDASHDASLADTAWADAAQSDHASARKTPAPELSDAADAPHNPSPIAASSGSDAGRLTAAEAHLEALAHKVDALQADLAKLQAQLQSQRTWAQGLATAAGQGAQDL